MKVMLVAEWDLKEDEVSGCDCESGKECTKQDTKQQDKKSSFETYNSGYDLGYEHGFKEAEIQCEERFESGMYLLLTLITKMKDDEFDKDTALDAIYEEVKKLVI